MLQEIIDLFISKQQEIKEAFKKEHPGSYLNILKISLQKMYPELEYEELDWENIHEIDDGDYQGTIIFLIPEKCYQPNIYYLTKVYYGSCSGCDTLQRIRSDYDDCDIVSDTQVEDYYTLALHKIQKMVQV